MSEQISVFIKTYGCQANEADSAGISQYLAQLGCTSASDESLADLLIINTCAIREKAEQKLYSYLGSLVDYQKNRPFMKIGVIGCVASYRKQEILDRFSHVSFVSGARDERGTFLSYLADLVVKTQTTKQLFAGEEREGIAQRSVHSEEVISCSTDASSDPVRDVKAGAQSGAFDPAQASGEAALRATLGGIIAAEGEALRSLVNITTGCNNYCTYCIVPFTRGREESYPLADIVMRVEHDVRAGAKEIMLIGQNVNSYTCPTTGARFAALLIAVAHIPGEFWVRYVSPHPKDMTRDVLEAMAAYPDKLCHWCHFPLQAGSTRILQLMNRTYTREEYCAQIDTIREILPEATITSDIIVGFPGETDAEYQETREVMEYVKFDQVFSFIYSRRKYTRAYAMGDGCPAEEKQSRLEGLQSRQKEICLERNRGYIGKKLRVLVEKKAGDGKLLARSSGNQRVILSGDEALVGTFVTVSIADAGPVNLIAE